MVPAALPPALALVAGAATGIAVQTPWRAVIWLLPALTCVAAFARWRRLDRVAWIVTVVAFGTCGVVLGSHARDAAIDTPLRLALDRELGGFLVDSPGLPPVRDPTLTRFRLTEDASSDKAFVAIRAEVLAVRLHGVWIDAGGGAVFSVGGRVDRDRVASWRRGRVLEAPVTFRRPARYLNAGVPDFERESALDGISLLGSIKSALVTVVIARGSTLEELAADVRAHVRRAVERSVGSHGALSGAIVSAVLIGDRTGLPDDIRARLQAAGTYHVIAISGGNTAILAGIILLVLAISAISRRRAEFVALCVLLVYAQVVTAGPSVWRATLVAAVYLVARVVDHRAAPWQAMAVAGGLLAVARPLDVRNAGFVLTFGATAALLEVARRCSARPEGRSPVNGDPRAWRRSRALAGWVATSFAASTAVEVVLLPVMSVTFSRITVAGLLLNLAAVPLMAVAQIAGLLTVCADSVDALAGASGWVAHLAAAGIVESARLVDVAPWLTWRVPSPSWWVVVAYYAGLAAILITPKLTKSQPRTARRSRRSADLVPSFASWAIFLASATLIVTGSNPLATSRARRGQDHLRLTVLDVGQGDAMVAQIPPGAAQSASPGSTLMVDSGGVPFGNSGFDVGARVVEPALWAAGVRALDTLLLTHGDPDHIGGAGVLIDDFRPGEIWQGIPVPRAAGLQSLLARAVDSRIPVQERRAGEEFRLGQARVVVLNPPPPDWERQKVRNDDSVVLEVLYGNVALLLAGDIGADVERDILPRLVPARIRILKVAHHGSRTSTSQALLDAWRPQIALISCGRGNPFGHPAADVIGRLEASGAQIYRTDRDGEITVDTDGQHVSVTTFTGTKQ